MDTSETSSLYHTIKILATYNYSEHEIWVIYLQNPSRSDTSTQSVSTPCVSKPRTIGIQTDCRLL